MERTSSRTLWIGLGILAVFLLFALPALGGGMMMARGVAGPFGFHPFIGTGAPWFWGFWGIGLLFRLAIWGAIIFLVVTMFRRSRFSTHERYGEPPSHSELTSQEILRRRYAAGEITREQYDEMRQVLQPSS